MPLGVIQGITDYAGYRLRELGIEDAQNLAYCDLNYLLKNWFNDRMLCDFVAQSLLFIQLKEDFAKLQNAGVRNIIAFKNILSDGPKRKEFAAKFEIKGDLDAVIQLISEPPLSERIETIEKIIKEFDRREIQTLQESGITGEIKKG